MTSRQFVAGMPAVVDGLLEPFGVYAGLDTQADESLRESLDPCVDVLRHLVVAHTDHTFAGSVPLRVA